MHGQQNVKKKNTLHMFTAPNTYLALLNNKAHNYKYLIPVSKVLPYMQQYQWPQLAQRVM